MKTQSAFLAALLSAASLITPNAPAATITWTNTAGGNWGTAANWSPNQVPTAADTVSINSASTFTITLNVAATNGDFIFAASGCTLTGASNHIIAGSLTWLAGTMAGTGT
ncbi:MAG TPA: hypothetical protein VI454_18070, partial [Verrucomicrobiae bacterium]